MTWVVESFNLYFFIIKFFSKMRFHIFIITQFKIYFKFLIGEKLEMALLRALV